MTRLRGHHLICLHFFSGEGYDQEFIENLRDVLATAEAEGIEVSEGPDDICRKCPYLRDKSCQYAEDADRQIRAMDELAAKLLQVRSGAKVQWRDLREKLPEAFREWYEAYCGECDWKWACEKRDLYRELKEVS